MSSLARALAAVIGNFPSPGNARTETNTLSPLPTSLEACSESACLRLDEHADCRSALAQRCSMTDCDPGWAAPGAERIHDRKQVACT
jgi:hypothetical protein